MIIAKAYAQPGQAPAAWQGLIIVVEHDAFASYHRGSEMHV